MIAFAYYLMKVVLCSGALYGYYHLMLRDKVFHQWNRFYLLGSVAVSLLLPLVNIRIHTPAHHESRIISALEIVSGADEYFNVVKDSSHLTLNLEMMAGLGYSAVSLVILFLFIRALERIRRMIRRNRSVAIDDFYFLNTTEPGTPFSFLRFLLWNTEIPLDTENGKRILEHELAHIREKHSWDKIFLQLILAAFWVNPFFWFIRRELTLVHEFIADRKAIGNGDTQAFARLLLETSFPGYAPMLTQTFFKTSIKRRLSMITKQQNPGFRYLGRLMMIPLLFILLFTFGLKAKTIFTETQSYVSLENPFTVVVDAGHGGEDAGAINGSLKEKDLNLVLARLVKQLNSNVKINIILARSEDVLQPIQDKVKLTGTNHADLFLSIHTNASPSPENSGIVARVGGKNGSFNEQNIRFASLLLNNLSAIYKTDNKINRPEKGVYVLDNNVCPSAMIECGYITNTADAQFFSLKSNQEKIARQILKSIEDYFSNTVSIQSVAPQAGLAPGNRNDSIPGQAKPTTVTFVYANGTQETLTPEQYRKKTGRVDITFTSDTIHVNGNTLEKRENADSFFQKATIIVDGRELSREEAAKIDMIDLEKIEIGKSPDNGKDRILITTKNKTNADGSPPITIPGAPEVRTISPDAVTIQSTPSTGGITIQDLKPKPLYVVGGKEVTAAYVESIGPEKISSVNVLKGEAARASYGDKGKNGVLVITLKK